MVIFVQTHRDAEESLLKSPNPISKTISKRICPTCGRECPSLVAKVMQKCHAIAEGGSVVSDILGHGCVP